MGQDVQLPQTVDLQEFVEFHPPKGYPQGIRCRIGDFSEFHGIYTGFSFPQPREHPGPLTLGVMFIPPGGSTWNLVDFHGIPCNSWLPMVYLAYSAPVSGISQNSAEFTRISIIPWIRDIPNFWDRSCVPDPGQGRRIDSRS